MEPVLTPFVGFLPLWIKLWKLWIVVGSCVVLDVPRPGAPNPARKPASTPVDGADNAGCGAEKSLGWSGDPSVLPVRNWLERP